VAEWTGEKKAVSSPTKFWAVKKLREKIFCCYIFIQKCEIEVKQPFQKNFSAKLKILSTHNLFCRKLAAVWSKFYRKFVEFVRKLQLSAPLTFCLPTPLWLIVQTL